VQVAVADIVERQPLLDAGAEKHLAEACGAGDDERTVRGVAETATVCREVGSFDSIVMVAVFAPIVVGWKRIARWLKY
jgi:hypothetical protein